MGTTSSYTVCTGQHTCREACGGDTDPELVDGVRGKSVNGNESYQRSLDTSVSKRVAEDHSTWSMVSVATELQWQCN